MITHVLPAVQGFLRPKFNRYLVIALLVLGGILAFSSEAEPVQEQEGLVVNFFYLPTCPHCTEQKPIIYELQEEMADVSFAFYDASSDKGSKLFYGLASAAGMDTSRLAVPTTFVGEHPLIGFHSKQAIHDAILECQENCAGKINGYDGSFSPCSGRCSRSYRRVQPMCHVGACLFDRIAGQYR